MVDRTSSLMRSLRFVRASTTPATRANRFQECKRCRLSFLMRWPVADAPVVRAPPANAIGQDRGDAMHSVNRREVIALDLVVGVNRHVFVPLSCPRGGPAEGGAVACHLGVNQHLRGRFRSWRKHRVEPRANQSIVATRSRSAKTNHAPLVCGAWLNTQGIYLAHMMRRSAVSSFLGVSCRRLLTVIGRGNRGWEYRSSPVRHTSSTKPPR